MPNAPKTAAAHTKKMVLMSPERKNAITIKVKKKISAVPKSFIKNRHPMHPSAKARYLVKLRVDCKCSKVAAPTNTNAILTSSDGCTDSAPPPNTIQFFAPLISVPITSVATSAKIASTATGIRS